ncbi:MAG: nuclear transport factor 2 family protein [Proteobacteria bacterium]|nr:nuclear transport factor 2 family protein [Pseudomonadota bacterium]HQR03710.1 nuclear transport factor 2 family protein [Rhodocyclaceae bacterium]
MNPDLQTLLDKQALLDLNAAYCRAVDRKNYPLLRRLYHPDATDDHGDLYSGSAAGFVDYLEQVLPGMNTHHFIGNALFVVEGDIAEGEVYAVRHHLLPPAQEQQEAQELIVGGRYLDRYIRHHQGHWQFHHRHSVRDWLQQRPAPDASLTLATALRTEDISYRLLPRLARDY